MRRANFAPTGRGGPLMTDHLQDLELELELLKRKRQLIQQQQNEMLYRSTVDSRPTYGQPAKRFENRFNEPQHHNFSNLYDEAPRDNRPFAPKRRAQPDWAGASAERFNAPQSSFKRPRQGLNPPSRSFNENPTPMPSLLGPPKPLLSALAPQGNRRPLQRYSPKQSPRPNQQNFKRNFKPTPNKASLATPDVFKVKESLNPISPDTRKEKDKEFVLSADIEPPPKVNGRLELALGTIVKEFKKAHGGHLFASAIISRLMKKAIRERVRSAMVGKVVGNVPAIVAEYRKAFPPSTDADILELATVKKQDTAELAIKLLEEGDPEQYFKNNIRRLMEVKLDEMFEKAEKMYNGEPASVIVEHLPDIKKSHQDAQAKKTRENVVEHFTQWRVGEKAPAELLSKEAEYEKWISMFIEWRLPRLLPKYKEPIIRLLDLDKMYSSTKAAIIFKTDNKALYSAMNKDEKLYYNTITSALSADDPVLPTHLPFFVRVQAVPTMPKRKQMQEFLHSFKPKTIKRHKKNNNLLFVGFAAKADYDKILQAHQSKIGKSTIHIVGNTAPKQSVFDADMCANDAMIDQVLTPQLDDQIDDLLSSIRKADEDAKEKEQNAEDAVIEINDQVENDNTAKADGNCNDSDVEEVKPNGDNTIVTVEDDDDDDEKNKVVPSKNDDVSEKNEVVPSKNDDDVSEKNEVVPSKNDEETPLNNDEETPLNNEEVIPVDDDEMAAKENDEETPLNNEEVIPVDDYEMAAKENDEVAPLKNDVVNNLKGTPAKSRAPATPSTIRTRRASRLAQN